MRLAQDPIKKEHAQFEGYPQTAQKCLGGNLEGGATAET